MLLYYSWLELFCFCLRGSLIAESSLSLTEYKCTPSQFSRARCVVQKWQNQTNCFLYQQSSGTTRPGLITIMRNRGRKMPGFFLLIIPNISLRDIRKPEGN